MDNQNTWKELSRVNQYENKPTTIINTRKNELINALSHCTLIDRMLTIRQNCMIFIQLFLIGDSWTRAIPSIISSVFFFSSFLLLFLPCDMMEDGVRELHVLTNAWMHSADFVCLFIIWQWNGARKKTCISVNWAKSNVI